MSELIKYNISQAKNNIKHGNFENAVSLLKNILLNQPNNTYAKKTLKKIEKNKNDLFRFSKQAPNELINKIVLCYSNKNYTFFDLLIESNIKKYEYCPFINQFKGVSLKRKQKFTEAIIYFNKSIELNPNYWESFNNLGNLYFEMKMYNEALWHYDKVIEINPHFSGAFCNRSNVNTELENYKSALDDLNQAIKIDQNAIIAWYNKGNVLTKLGQFQKAIKCFEKTILLNPNYFEAYTNLSSCYEELGCLQDALSCINKALEINHNHNLSHYNKAVILFRLGDLNEAISSYDFIKNMPGKKNDIKWNKATCYLLLEDFTNGWDQFEARLLKKTWVPRTFNFKELKDKSEIQGSIIFLYSEQGLGDTIHFARYAKQFVDLGATVILEVQKPLLGLIEMFSGLTIIAKGDDIPKADFHLPLMSSPMILETNITNMPPVTKINVEKNRVEDWGKRLGKTGLKIGIAWQGNKEHEDDKKIEKLQRSFPLKSLVSQIACQNVRLISLQRDNSSIDITSQNSIEILGDDFDKFGYAFRDSVAVMQNLDLVITCDTSIAHLACSLNIPTWIALKYIPDWRWLLVRDDSPWYPSAKLFRQTEWGDWDGVFTKMKLQLNQKGVH